MPKYTATVSDTSPISSVFRGATDNIPVTLAHYIQTALTTEGDNNDLQAVLKQLWDNSIYKADFDYLRNLTRDLHPNAPLPDWDEAQDSEIDLYAVQVTGFQFPPTGVTLTDANFDNQGADIFLPDVPHVNHAIYARLPIGSDRSLYRLYLEGSSITGGLGWTSVTGPDEQAYTYWHITSVGNAPGNRAHAQTRDPVIHTRYDGETDAIDTFDALPPAADHPLDKVIYVRGGHWYRATAADDGTRAWTDITSEVYNRAPLKDRTELPDADTFEPDDIVVVEGEKYRLAITDESEPNIFTGTVGHDTFRTVGGESWRGIATSQSPNGFSTDGGFTANPGNTLSLVLSSSQGHLRVGIEQTAYVASKGSAFDSTDKVAIKITYPDDSTDEAVLSFYSAYTRLLSGTDTHYLLFQHRDADNGYNLYTVDDDTHVTIEFFTVDTDGAATTTPFLTHVVSLKHWLHFTFSEEDNLEHRIDETDQKIEALARNVQEHQSDTGSLGGGAALATSIPDPDTHIGADVIVLTEDEETTIGSWTGVKYGRGVYGLEDKPEDSSNNKLYLSFELGETDTWRGFAEGYVGVQADSLRSDGLQQPADFGNALVSPIGDGIVAFREYHEQIHTYWRYWLTIKRALYYDLLQRINGSDFGSTTSPSVDFAGFDVTIVRTDTGASVSSGGGTLYFQPHGTMNIAGVPYITLAHAHDTQMLAGIPAGTECLLSMRYHYAPNTQLFDSTVAKAWTRLDRHSLVTHELAKLKAEAIVGDGIQGIVYVATDAAYQALTKNANTMYVVDGADAVNRHIYLGTKRWE